MAKDNFKEFNIRDSPFHEEYNIKTGKNLGGVKIHPDKYNLLKKHFEGIYEKEAMTKGIRMIIDDYLDRLCLTKGIFNHLEAVMLIPKTDDIEDLEAQSQIIAIINTKSDFNKNYNHIHHFKDWTGIVFELHPFNKVKFGYVLEIFKNTIDSCVYNTSKEDMESFESFKQRQAELYPDLDIDDCYFVRFPLNNHMDNIHHGAAFHYNSWKNNHLGGYIFIDVLEGKKSEKFFIIDWFYLSEISSKIRADFQFIPKDLFMDNVRNSSSPELDSDKEDFIMLQLKSYFDGEYMKEYLDKIEKNILFKFSVIRNLKEEYYDE